MENSKYVSDWWEGRRLKYNLGLIIAGVLAFIAYSSIGSSLFSGDDFEVTFFTTLFQGFGYIFMMGAANVFYYLGEFADKKYNAKNDELFRKRLYNFGFWFSFGLPFLIPILLIVTYCMRY